MHSSITRQLSDNTWSPSIGLGDTSLLTIEMASKINAVPIEHAPLQFHRDPNIRALLQQDAAAALASNSTGPEDHTDILAMTPPKASLKGLPFEVRKQILAEVLDPRIDQSLVDAWRIRFHPSASADSRFHRGLMRVRTETEEVTSYHALYENNLSLQNTYLYMLCGALLRYPPPRISPHDSVLYVDRQLFDEGRDVVHYTPLVAVITRHPWPARFWSTSQTELPKLPGAHVVMTINLKDHFCRLSDVCWHENLIHYLHFDELEFLYPILVPQTENDGRLGTPTIDIWYGDYRPGGYDHNLAEQAYLDHVHTFMNDMVANVRPYYATCVRSGQISSRIANARAQSQVPNQDGELDLRPLAKRLVSDARKLENAIRVGQWRDTVENFIKLIQSLCHDVCLQRTIRHDQFEDQIGQAVFWLELTMSIFYLMSQVCLTPGLPYPGAYSERTLTWQTLQWTIVPYKFALELNSRRMKTLLKITQFRAMGRLGRARICDRILHMVLQWLVPNHYSPDQSKTFVDTGKRAAQQLKNKYLGANQQERSTFMTRWTEDEGYRGLYYDEVVDTVLKPLYATRFSDRPTSVVPPIQNLLNDYA